MKPLKRAILPPSLKPSGVSLCHSAGDERPGFATPRNDEFLDRLQLLRRHREQYFCVFPICGRSGRIVSIADLVLGNIEKPPKVLFGFNWTCAHTILHAPRRSPAVTR